MGKQVRTWLAAIAILCAAPGARAADEGWAGGVRLGYGKAMGDAVEGTPLGDVFGGSVPIWIELGRNLRPDLFVGGYFQYGLGQISSTACPAGLSCGGRSLRLGAEVIYRVSAGEPLVPWLGAGMGYEWASLEVSDGQGGRASTSLSGLELLNLQAGGDWRVSPRLSAGPFAMLSFGRYGTVSNGDASREVASSQATFHSWLQLGIRGSFDL